MKSRGRSSKTSKNLSSVKASRARGGLSDVLQHVMGEGSRRLDVSTSVEKALRGIVHPLGVEEMVSEIGFSSQVRVYMEDRYGLRLMTFYVFTCLVLGITSSMNFARAP